MDNHSKGTDFLNTLRCDITMTSLDLRLTPGQEHREKKKNHAISQVILKECRYLSGVQEFILNKGTDQMRGMRSLV